MQPFTVHTGRGVPLRRGNVDTDQIIPAVYLKRVTRTGFADGLFATWRRDPDFVLNNPVYQGASVLVAGPDFGTGSSREHAVWALQDYGFRVVLSACFGDIFRGNALKGGLLAAVMEQRDVERLWALVEADPAVRITVHLAELEVRCGSIAVPFEVDDYARWRLLQGVDDIDLTLRHVAEIAAYEARRSDLLLVPAIPGSSAD